MFELPLSFSFNMLSTSCLSVLFISTLSVISASNSPSSIRNKRICRSCGELAKEVDKRMEETAANPRIIQVAARIGADGRPIPGRKIDYMTS